MEIFTFLLLLSVEWKRVQLYLHPGLLILIFNAVHRICFCLPTQWRTTATTKNGTEYFPVNSLDRDAHDWIGSTCKVMGNSEK